ncbi:DNA polymerase/3'-5' exonuclease PolX [Candidatus Woesearchaeota archaeon]|nr:DNA polymerase/3'-5' exonuclease PolX [Candidatus Woesearchaeota archaeon]
MKNHEVSALLNRIADYLEIKDDIVFKIRAYRKAALVIEGLSEDIEEIKRQGRLGEIPGVGKAITEKVTEFLDTGKLAYLGQLKKEVPVNLEELDRISGLGPKTIMKLYRQLNVKNIKELEKAAKEGKIRSIEGLGEKVEQNILKGIEFAKHTGERHLLGQALIAAGNIKEKLLALKEIQNIEVAGSLRRMKETIGDIDILVSSKNPGKIMDFFTSLQNISKILAKGDTKSSIILEDGIQVDLRVIGDKLWGSALLYFTGSQQHNIELRKIAIKKGMKLSEYGVFDKKTNKLLASKTEKDCYKKLELPYIEPELREDEGEIDVAMKGKLPKIVGYRDIKGDLQMHSVWSDGANSIEEMALAAKALGHEYICVTDHSGGLEIAGALDEKRIRQQWKEIDKLNKKMEGITVLKGTEVNITSAGRLDMPNSALKGMDVVVASVHSGLKNPKDKMTERLVKAMESEHVDIIGHPTGRKINERPPYDIDMAKIFDKAKETKTLLEINSSPERLDLNDVNVRVAVKVGVKLVISTDAHSAEQLSNIKFGIATARRGWAEGKNIANTLPLKRFLQTLK